MFASQYGTEAKRVWSDPKRVFRRANQIYRKQLVGIPETVDCMPGLGKITSQSGSAPDIGVIALIPVDEALAPGNAWGCCPASSKTDVVLAIEEVGSKSGIEIHGLESLKGNQRCARPFPKTSGVTLTTKMAGISHWHGMPVLERNVPTIEVDEEAFWIG